MELVWWYWMVFGLALGLAELAVPSFFLIWFALGALLTGAALLVVAELSLAAQILLWTLASAAMTVLWFKVLRDKSNRMRSGQADDVLGEIGVLVRAVQPFEKGEVRFQKPVMGSEVWPCLADEAIAAGERVRVLAVDGQLLKVGKS